MRQVVMRHEDLEHLPELILPENYRIHTADVDCVAAWEAIVESSFEAHCDYSDKTARPGWSPERMYFVEINGVDVATATSYDHPDYPGYGFLHMVATHKAAARKGAGSLAVLAVLHGLREMGKMGCVLTTDDFRLPAIKMYLSLGFVPEENDDEMVSRWKAIRKQLKRG